MGGKIPKETTDSLVYTKPAECQTNDLDENMDEPMLDKQSWLDHQANTESAVSSISTEMNLFDQISKVDTHTDVMTAKQFPHRSNDNVVTVQTDDGDNSDDSHSALNMPTVVSWSDINNTEVPTAGDFIVPEAQAEVELSADGSNDLSPNKTGNVMEYLRISCHVNTVHGQN